MKKKFLFTFILGAVTCLAAAFCVSCSQPAPEQEHTHSFTLKVAEKDFLKTEADCRHKAVYYKSCECGERSDEVFEYGDFGEHVEGKPVIENEIEGDCIRNGSYEEVVYCSVCGEEISRQTKPTPLKHSYNTEWSFDKAVHWHECGVCGDKKDIESHEGGDPIIENEIEGDCIRNGSYEEVVYCSVCGEEISRQIKSKPLKHSYNTEWSFDKAAHWHECGVCGDKKDIESHEFEDGKCVCGCVDVTANLNYTLNADGETYACSGFAEGADSNIDVSIASEYDGKTVTTIDTNAFYGSDIKSLTIPATVTDIKQNALKNCNQLTKIIYAGNIGGWCSIDGLLNIEWTPERTLYFGGKAQVGELIIPDGVTGIKMGAFRGYGKITSLTIGSGVENIDYFAFQGCTGLTTVNWNAIDCGSSVSLFEDCENIRFINIGDGVQSIPARAFDGCDKVKDVVIPDGVRSVGASAFNNCSGIINMTVPDSVTQIGERAFYGCSSIKSIHIPTNLGEIADYTFYGCEGLTGLTIPEEIYAIGGHAFERCKGLKSVNIPKSHTKISVYAFSYCSGIKSIVIPDNVTEIGAYAFNNCSGLTSLTVPEKVTKIGMRAFAGCSGLVTVNWNATACERADCEANGSWVFGIFYACRDIATVNIGENVTTLPSHVFYGCAGLKSVSIPDSVKNISDCAFSECTELKSVVISKNIQSIGWHVFDGCELLDTVFFTGTAEDWDNINISNYGNTTLKNAVRYYYSETEPEGDNYWRYDTDGKTPVKWTNT